MSTRPPTSSDRRTRRSSRKAPQPGKSLDLRKLVALGHAEQEPHHEQWSEWGTPWGRPLRPRLCG